MFSYFQVTLDSSVLKRNQSFRISDLIMTLLQNFIKFDIVSMIIQFKKTIITLKFH